MNISDIIVRNAHRDLGQKEIRGNQGWIDPDFEAEMRLTGWELGQAWCSYWAEKTWVQSYLMYSSIYVRTLQRLFSANAVQTFENFKYLSRFKTDLTPSLGALAVYEKVKNGLPSRVGSSKWVRGHIGIVGQIIDPDFKRYITYDGNSNSSGSREGIEVASNERCVFDEIDKKNGLKLLGFIHPKE